MNSWILNGWCWIEGHGRNPNFHPTFHSTWLKNVGWHAGLVCSRLSVSLCSNIKSYCVKFSLFLCDVMVLHFRRKIFPRDVISFDDDILILNQVFCWLNFLFLHIFRASYSNKWKFLWFRAVRSKLFLFTVHRTFGFAVPAFKFQYLTDSFALFIYLLIMNGPFWLAYSF